ncbi:MFS transporter [Nonomuraea sp. GTA35]|uniref:MFS transporter n=1 Tax=Nonomuraea sp. GTA35 TaxID=1676746 RepID=UPI0035C195D0
MLTDIGADFGISDGTTGLTMTLPGVVAAVAAPAVTLATARLDRRGMLCVLMAVLAVADVLAAVATSYWVMLISRVLAGLTIGGFWSIGAGLAALLMLLPPLPAHRVTSPRVLIDLLRSRGPPSPCRPPFSSSRPISAPTPTSHPSSRTSPACLPLP